MNMNWKRGVMTFITAYSSFSFAENIQIEVKVVATEKAAAVGYLVEGKSSGGLGAAYSGRGPSNKRYKFGYRKKLFGEDITCGIAVLNKSTKVQIVVKGDSCYTIYN